MREAHRSHLMPNLNSLRHALSKNQRSQNTTRKRIARSVRIDNLVLEGRDGVTCGGALGGGNDRLACSLGEDHSPFPGRVGFGQVGNTFSDLGKIIGWESLGSCLCFRFIFVSDKDISVREDLVQLSLEELRDEWC